jgi:hypothetical protein
MMKRARKFKPKVKELGPQPFTMAWLDKLDELYEA